MAIPDFQTLLRPILEHGALGERGIREATDTMCDAFELTAEEREQLLPSGAQRTISNRVAWAVTYLVKAGLLVRPRRGCFVTTDEGRRLLSSHAGRIDLSLLSRFDGVRSFRGLDDAAATAPTEHDAAVTTRDATPIERIDQAQREIFGALRAELLERVRALSPEAFERLIVDVMIALGYGAKGEGRRLGRSGDGGVDGIITEDRLGLDVIFLQAKRYAADASIGPNLIREFAGALDERGTTKGVFVATSPFTSGAVKYAKRSPKRIVLLDGDRLAELMIERGVGVRVEQTVQICALDLNYFDEV
jgi:restriction system protein